MGGISVKQKGDFKKALNFMKHTINAVNDVRKFDKYGKKGVEVLRAATPKDSGDTANSWRYEILTENERISIRFYNTNMADNVSIAILLQYGHATGTGGWVEGMDYINPAIQPIFKDMAEEAWKEVIKV